MAQTAHGLVAFHYGLHTGDQVQSVEELVVLHKGSVNVESVFGQGSVFLVTLPRSLNQE